MLLTVDRLLALLSLQRPQRRSQPIAASRVWCPFLPSLSMFHSGPRRKGSAPPRASRTPLTAPGRCRRILPYRREGRKEMKVLSLLKLERVTQVPDEDA